MEMSNGVGKIPSTNSGTTSSVGTKTNPIVNRAESQVNALGTVQGEQAGNSLLNGGGLAAMFANTGQRVQNGSVQGSQGLSGMLDSYLNMWQPNGGNSYQIVGGVGNII